MRQAPIPGLSSNAGLKVMRADWFWIDARCMQNQCRASPKHKLHCYERCSLLPPLVWPRAGDVLAAQRLPLAVVCNACAAIVDVASKACKACTSILKARFAVHCFSKVATLTKDRDHSERRFHLDCKIQLFHTCINGAAVQMHFLKVIRGFNSTVGCFCAREPTPTHPLHFQRHAHD
jgi:hypothetical protein